MTALDRLLDTLPPWTLVGGKGGVGKTTAASALARRAAERGERTLLLSTDPAGTLGDALGAPLSGVPEEIPGHSGLFAAQLDARAARDAFLARWRGALVTILDRGTFLAERDVAGLVDAALPGLDETMALLTLLDLERGGWGRVVLDSAPTGHTLRLLQLPATFDALLSLLDAMQEKHRFMVRALTRRYRGDEADRFIDEMRGRLTSLRAVLADPVRFAVVLVTRPEPLVVEETVRYARALAAMRIGLRAVVVNAVPAVGAGDAASSLQELSRAARGAEWYGVPVVRGGEEWGASVRVAAEAGVRDSGFGTRDSGVDRGASAIGARPAPLREGAARTRAPSLPLSSPESRVPSPAPRPLTIVGGKGGVGKSTVACALGVVTASAEREVLVVSTDPAPSVGDALAQPVGEAVVAVTGAPGLHAQQLDASAAFARFRTRFERRVDELFDGLMRGGMDASHDRRITRDLLALAPPGIDELYALATLGDTVTAGRWSAVIVDPAPTGHLMRLLELPEIALDWTHRLMRIMLEHRELVGLGDAAEELLGFARRTRALAASLRDPARTAVVVVALDEPLVRGETVRLIDRVRALGIDVPALVWNRVSDSALPLPPTVHIAQFEAAEATPPPRGVEALRRWARAWTPLSTSAHE